MSDQIKSMDYYYTTVGNEPGEGRRLFEHLSEKGVNLMAFTAYPTEDGRTQIDFFADDARILKSATHDSGIKLTGPRKAFLIQGDDRLGVLHQHHLTLANAGINVTASMGVTDGDGRFGFVLWVDQADFMEAAKVLMPEQAGEAKAGG